MRKVLFSCLSVMAMLGYALGAEQTLTGKLSDSKCGAKHMTEAEHGKASMSDRDCVLACVKSGGQYVFVQGSKVYKIANQEFADLEKHAGHSVKVTGDVAGDTITITKVAMGSTSD
jgi:hypothetical protein